MRLNYSGLIIAGLGFVLTRFTVTLAINGRPLEFYFAGVIPLVLGLGLAAFGIALTVADVDASFVRTVALWCVVGAGAMAILVALTVVGTMRVTETTAILSQTYLSNFLIGGSVGGTLTGLYAAHNRRQQTELVHQANRLEVLNRLLRHEILNSVTIIRGYAGLGQPDDLDTQSIIETESDAIAETVEEVRYLTKSTMIDETTGVSTDLRARLDEAAERVRMAHPEATISVRYPPGSLQVMANSHLTQVFEEVLENAVIYASTESPTVDVAVRSRAENVVVAISDAGPGLPASRRELLESGTIGEFDDPEIGYGLNVVRLLMETYRGSIETVVDRTGSTISLTFRRPTPETTGFSAATATLTGVRPALPQLLVALVASIVAGIAFGVVARVFGGSIAVIGVYYGAESLLVGWITHEFHSVVFGFMFAGLVSLLPESYRNSLPAFVGVGIGWGLVLWFVAAGVVSAVWLRLLGIPVPIPSLSSTTLATHLVWGATLGVATVLGYRHVSPRLATALQ